MQTPHPVFSCLKTYAVHLAEYNPSHRLDEVVTILGGTRNGYLQKRTRLAYHPFLAQAECFVLRFLS